MVRINILLPVLNDLEGLRRSLESIERQNFNRKDIFTVVVDFGSSDGSYEEALKHSYQTGVYRLKPWRNQSLRAAASKFWRETCLSGAYTIKIVMSPGDELYPDFLTCCSELWIAHIRENPCILVCEADIRQKNGQIKRQTPLYENIRIIDGEKEPEEYLKKGMFHAIYCFGGELSDSRYQMSGLINERFWWNNLLLMGMDHRVLYTPQRLVCVPERIYEDELWEILKRWENVINVSRRYQAFYRGEANRLFEKTGNKSAACYALWRAFLLEQAGRKEEAANCLSISVVIDPETERLPLYVWLLQWLSSEEPKLLRQAERFLKLAEDKTVEEWESLNV